MYPTSTRVPEIQKIVIEKVEQITIRYLNNTERPNKEAKIRRKTARGECTKIRKLVKQPPQLRVQVKIEAQAKNSPD